MEQHSLTQYDTVAPLTTEDDVRATHCDSVVRESSDRLWPALAEIRDKRLYRKWFSSFEEYCQDRLGHGRNYINRQIVAVGIIERIEQQLVPIGTNLPIPQTESQVRPLAQLPPEEQAGAWMAAVERSGGKPTAKVVEQVVRERAADPELRFDPTSQQACCGHCDRTHEDWQFNGQAWVCQRCGHAVADQLMDIAEEPEPEEPPIIADDPEDLENSTPEIIPIPTTPDEPQQQVVVRFTGYSSATAEWYTPKHIIERVIRMFGTIDLDPCSNSADKDVANVPAETHYTKDDDGLAQRWFGRVYMNPPYGDEIGAWVKRLFTAYEEGEIAEGIALLPGRADTAWFQDHLADCRWCWVRGRLRFSSSENSAPFPSIVVYFGKRDMQFWDCFGDIGLVR